MLIPQSLVFPFILVFFEMATYLSSDMYLPALPTVMDVFQITHAQAQATLTVWFLGAISVQLILGPLSDRYGRKGVLCLGSVLFMLSTLVCTLASHISILLLGRFIQGSGICFMAVPGYASIHELFDQKQAIRIIALMASVSVLAPALGPLLGSVLLLTFNWRWIFGFLTLWALIAVILLILWMPETLPIEKRHLLNIKKIINAYWRLLTHARFMTIMTIYGFLICGFLTWIAAGPFLIIDQFHYSPIWFGVFQGLIFIAFIFGNQGVKLLIDHQPLWKIIKIGLWICLLASLMSLILSIIFPKLVWIIVLGYTAYAFGAALACAPLNRLAVEATEELMGARMAIFSMLISSFAALGSVLVSIFYNGSLVSLASMIFCISGVSWMVVYWSSLEYTSSACH